MGYLNRTQNIYELQPVRQRRRGGCPVRRTKGTAGTAASRPEICYL